LLRVFMMLSADGFGWLGCGCYVSDESDREEYCERDE